MAHLGVRNFRAAGFRNCFSSWIPFSAMLGRMDAETALFLCSGAQPRLATPTNRAAYPQEALILGALVQCIAIPDQKV